MQSKTGFFYISFLLLLFLQLVPSLGIFYVTFTAMLIYNNYFVVSIVHFSPSLLVFVFFDLFHSCYIAWNCVRNILFCLHFTFLYSYVFNQHANRLNRLLKMTTIQGMSILTTSFSSSLTFVKQHDRVVAHAYRTLNHFYKQFLWLISVSIQFNVVISPLAVSGLIFHTALNLLLVANIFFRKLAIFEQLLLLFVVLVQVALALLLSSSLIIVSQAYSRSDMLLYRVQQTLSRLTGSDKFVGKKMKPVQKQVCWNNWKVEVLAKLKLATFYEYLCTEHVFRHTVGSLGKLSWPSLFKFFYSYIGYLLYVSKMVRHNRL